MQKLMEKTLVVIPTYNEKDNIIALLEHLFKELPEVHALVVDDNSPDGTAKIVEEKIKADPRVHLLLRQKKEGLGKAYLAGFRWALDKGYDVIVEMDADFSHRAVDLKQMLEVLKGADAVVGSRWVKGGGTINWGLGRKIISRGGSFYSRMILGYPVRDWTGGFNAWRRKVIEYFFVNQIESNGYSFQIELKYKALKHGFKVVESPILFEDRRVGQSKMSGRIVREALWRVWKIRFQ